MTRLADPAWLGLLALAPVPWLRGRGRPGLAWPTLAGFGGSGRRRARLLRVLPDLIRGLAIACLAVAMARPQVPGGHVRVAGLGVAIVVAIDRSPSMSAADYPSGGGKISRLEAARATLSRFIRGREDDLIGVVQFARYPDVIAAPTLDRRFLLDAVRSIRPAALADVGTSLGDAIVEGLGALRGVPSRRKVLILLTDGRDEPAGPRPVAATEAAGMARELGVTLHAIAVVPPAVEGAGSDPSAAGPDRALLRGLAESGGGRLFEAADAEGLNRVFDQINSLEKSPIAGTVRTVYRERYAPWAAAGLALLAVNLGLSRGRLRRLP